MDRVSRWNAIVSLLADHGRLSVKEVAERLDASEATVRRDFDQLSRQQLVTRTRGGVTNSMVAYDLPLRYKTARHNAERQRIATVAAAMVTPGQAIGLNGGTTTTEVARALVARAEIANQGAEWPTVTVVTNALNIAGELVLRPTVKTVLTGGVARQQSYELIGPLATRLLEDLWLDILFLGVNGIDAIGGATANHEGEAGINGLMVRRSSRVVVVADGTKLGQVMFCRIAPIESIDVLVTDRGADPVAVEAIRAAGVEVVTA